MNEGLGLVKMMADYIYLLKYYDSLMGGFVLWKSA